MDGTPLPHDVFYELFEQHNYHGSVHELPLYSGDGFSNGTAESNAVPSSFPGHIARCGLTQGSDAIYQSISAPMFPPQDPHITSTLFPHAARQNEQTPSEDLFDHHQESEHDGQADDDEELEEPWSHVIYRALMSEEKTYSRPLADIYEWIAKNTDKVKEKDKKGWKNSVRHNLSMNIAFEKVNPEAKSRKGSKSVWRLVPKYIGNGVNSTTRYRRKDPDFKRPRKSKNPAPQRMASGAKGGQASRRAAQQRRRRARLREAIDGDRPALLRSQQASVGAASRVIQGDSMPTKSHAVLSDLGFEQTNRGYFGIPIHTPVADSALNLGLGDFQPYIMMAQDNELISRSGLVSPPMSSDISPYTSSGGLSPDWHGIQQLSLGSRQTLSEMQLA